MSHPEAMARYEAEMDEVLRDRAMAARFNPTTTAAWLIELDHEERAVRKALFRLRARAEAAGPVTPSVSPRRRGAHGDVRRCA